MSNKVKILVTGGSGMVGSQARFGVKPKRSELDILKPASITRTIKKYQPSVIVHLAAMTDMLACENNPKQAYQVNVVGTRNIAQACRDNNIKLVYLSTGAVFDGKKSTPYQETDKTNPVNVYGKTKLLGEKEVQKLLPDALIVRTGWLFGGGLKLDKKFVALTYKKLNQGLDTKATADRYGSPTYIPDLLRAIEKLIAKNAQGIFHVVNSGSASYYDVARMIKKIGRFTQPILPVKATTVESPKVKRGKMEALMSSKIKLRSWKKALEEYLNNL